MGRLVASGPRAGRTGIANLPLHSGKAPPWLFQRMTKLSREITIAIVTNGGPEELLRRLSDPFWFQALGCLLGFDWHSSGLTTTVCGALKEGIKGIEEELGLFIAGGKGRASRRTPSQVEEWGERLSLDPSALVYASRMAAKVDNSALQDGYQLYHHTFLFTARGEWGVVQQGMNDATGYARRYHWLGSRVQDFVCEPHAAICSPARGQALNLVARESAQARSTMVDIASNQQPEQVVKDLEGIRRLDLPARHHLTGGWIFRRGTTSPARRSARRTGARLSGCAGIDSRGTFRRCGRAGGWGARPSGP